MDKKGKRAGPEQDQRPKPAGFPATAPSHSLLDDPAAKIGIHQTPFSIPDRLAQAVVTQRRFTGKASKRLVFEYPHAVPHIGITLTDKSITLSVIYYKEAVGP